MFNIKLYSDFIEHIRTKIIPKMNLLEKSSFNISLKNKIH